MRRILIVGGSTAFATGTPDDEHTWAVQLERRLPNSEVINGAVIGYVSGQEVSLFVSDLGELQPDLVIVLNGWNDFEAVGRMPARYGGHAGETFQEFEDQLERLHSLTRFNPVGRISYDLEQAFIPAIGERIRSSWPGARREEHLTLTAAVDQYVRNTIKVSTIARAWQARCLVLFQPLREPAESANGRAAPDPSVAGYARFRRAAADALRRQGVEVGDLNDQVGQFTRGMFMDDVHLTAEGNARLADVVSAVLSAKNALDPSLLHHDDTRR